MSILELPDEIIRKIICSLPPKMYISFNIVNKDIISFGLNKLLLPWKIEGYFPINKTVTYSQRLDFYNNYVCGTPFSDNINEIIIELNRIVGDYTIYDHNYSNTHMCERKLYNTLHNIRGITYNRYIKNNIRVKALI
jgi:hypothetical protein